MPMRALETGAELYRLVCLFGSLHGDLIRLVGVDTERFPFRITHLVADELVHAGRAE